MLYRYYINNTKEEEREKIIKKSTYNEDVSEPCVYIGIRAKTNDYVKTPGTNDILIIVRIYQNIQR